VLRTSSLIALVLLLAGAGAAFADEAKTQVSAAMILSIVSEPVANRVSAFDDALKRPSPTASADGATGEVSPDGSVRYGRTVITVRNPCPPGEHFDLPPLPGRRAR
jgi:hypothetical protein